MEEQSIVSQLPALLRYARSLTRSRYEGEALVETVLTSLLAGQTALEPSLSVRSGLLSLVHRHWIPMDVAPSSPGDLDNPLFAELSRAEAEDRAVLLLIRFEGLSVAEAARILGKSQAEVARRLVDAERRLFRQAYPRVLIVADQPEDGLDLDELLANLSCEVVGPVDISDAAAAAALEQPDLILTFVSRQNIEASVAATDGIDSHRGIPVVVLTTTNGETAGRHTAASDPLERTVIMTLINRALGRT
ncbi:sigma factor-like helix-turn-helix DNA-binding protein [Thalassobaculum sp.]|uniref:sigma factor-like helix-turn-helix DNA-binding protein n=1 Tax=Thalassobaculum sp. TaxID=2022740 RepID=UPI0032EE3536